MIELIDDINDAIRELKIIAMRSKAKPLIRPSTDYRRTRQLVIQGTKEILAAVEEMAAEIYPAIEELVNRWARNQINTEKQETEETEEHESLIGELELLDLDREDIFLILAIASLYDRRMTRMDQTLRTRMAGTLEKTYTSSLESLLRSLNLRPSAYQIPDVDPRKINARFQEYARPALQAFPRRMAKNLGDTIAELKTREVAAQDIAQRILSRLKPGGEEWTKVSYQFERIARTELAAATQTAKLEAFQAAGVSQVMYVTARDSKVCGRCLKYEGRIFNASDPILKTLIPMHPNCRCTIVPVAPKDTSWLQLPRR